MNLGLQEFIYLMIKTHKGLIWFQVVNHHTWMELRGLEFEESERGKWLGSSVIRQLKEYARQQRKPIWLIAANDTGSFYETLGFTAADGWLKFGRLTEVYQWTP